MTSLTNLIHGLPSGKFEPQLRALYGEDTARHTARLLDVAQTFEELFGAAEHAEVFSAPGRSEIGGNHTDHNRGRVIAAAVNLDILGVVAQRGDMRMRIREKSAGHEMNDLDLNSLEIVEQERGRSAAMIRGICAGLVQRGYNIGGFEAATHSEVLNGSGLSSSAAFEIFIATVLNYLYNDGKIPPLEIAQICQYAENVYAGKPCGLLDQATSAIAGFISIDFESLQAPAVTKVDFDFEACGHALCVVNSGGSHADLTGDYAAVRGEMELVARALGCEVLRETSREALFANMAHVREQCGDRAILRALHFFAENERVDAQSEALAGNDFDAFLQLIKASGRSSFMYNQNVYTGRPAGEQPVSLALALSETILRERGAWRVHGGGFAGTVLAFVPTDLLGIYRAQMEAVFGQGSCYVLKVRPQGGVKVI